MIARGAPEETVPELVKGLGEDVRQLVTDEIALAKAELKATLRRGIKLAAGALAVLLGGALLALFALITLVEWIPNHVLVAGLIAAVGMLMVLGGGGMIWTNRKLFPFPETRASLEEDLEWARLQSRRVRR